MEYCIKRLGSITTLITKGTTPSNIGETFTNQGVMFFRSELIGKTKHVDKSKGLLFISEETHKKLKRSQIKCGDLLFSIAGAYLGKLSLVAVDDVPSNTNQAVALIRFKPNVCNIDYVYYYMLQEWYNEYICSFNAQAAQPNINLEQISKLKLNLPSREKQDKIASILSAYDNLIENNNKRIKILEQMAENLYKEWFVRFRFPDYQNTEFENGIPKGWKVENLDDFGITLDTGSRPSGGIDDSLCNGVPSLGAEAIKELAEFDYSSVKYVPIEYYEKMKRGKFDKNAILLYKDGAYIGKTTIFRNGFPFVKFAVNEHVFLIKANNFAYQNYLYFTLHQKEYFYTMQNLNRNAAQPGLAQPDIKRVKIVVPVESVVEKYNQIIEPLLDAVFQLAKINRNLIKQRDMLLPRLMSGKLEVK